MPLVKEKRLNVNYYKLLPEGAPYQLIEGKLVMTPAPNPEHQMVLANIFDSLRMFTKNIGLALCAPVDVFLDDENAFQPDLIFISRENLGIIKEDGIYGPPDLVIEILSPSTAHYDLREKFRVYERSGVKEYWIVDPGMKIVEIYRNGEKGFSFSLKAEGNSEARSSLLEGFSISLGEIFRPV